MGLDNEVGQFDLLEQKIDGLISMVETLRQEKASLAEKVQMQERRLSDLNAELEDIRTANDKAKERIAALLEKIEKADLQET